VAAVADPSVEDGVLAEEAAAEVGEQSAEPAEGEAGEDPVEAGKEPVEAAAGDDDTIENAGIPTHNHAEGVKPEGQPGG
jgi:hypothetical protein